MLVHFAQALDFRLPEKFRIWHLWQLKKKQKLESRCTKKGHNPVHKKNINPMQWLTIEEI